MSNPEKKIYQAFKNWNQAGDLGPDPDIMRFTDCMHRLMAEARDEERARLCPECGFEACPKRGDE